MPAAGTDGVPVWVNMPAVPLLLKGGDQTMGDFIKLVLVGNGGFIAHCDQPGNTPVADFHSGIGASDRNAIHPNRIALCCGGKSVGLLEGDAAGCGLEHHHTAFGGDDQIVILPCLGS